MAHVKKYTRGALHNMLAHYDRTAKNSRENIDPSLTHLNYNLTWLKSGNHYHKKSLLINDFHK